VKAGSPASNLVSVVCGLLLLATGCRHQNLVHVPPPPTVACNATTQNGVSTQTATASTIIGSNQFTATYTKSLAFSSGGALTSEDQLVVQRSVPGLGATQAISLQVDSQSSSSGVLQVSATFGTGFQGVKQITLTSGDGATVQGTVDGAALAPFPIQADPKSVKLANGSAIPAMTVDSDTQQALPLLVQAIGAKCAKTTGTSASAVPSLGGSGSPNEDPPAHFYNAYSSVPCLTCLLGCESVDTVCWGTSAVLASFCGPLYGICLAGELGYCEYKDVGCYGGTPWTYSVSASGISVNLGPVGPCHMLGPSELRGATPSSMGPPCCPTFCGTSTALNSGSFCCGTGESCAAPPLCCSAGLTACGGNCCPSGQTCIGNNTCCPSGSACGSNCCAAGQACVGGNTCCDPSNSCGSNCCSAGQTCMQDGITCCAPANVCSRNCCAPGEGCASNGTCCPVGHAVCNGLCCPNLNSACDPATNSCSCAGG